MIDQHSTCCKTKRSSVQMNMLVVFQIPSARTKRLSPSLCRQLHFATSIGEFCRRKTRIKLVRIVVSLRVVVRHIRYSTVLSKLSVDASFRREIAGSPMLRSMVPRFQAQLPDLLSSRHCQMPNILLIKVMRSHRKHSKIHTVPHSRS